MKFTRICLALIALTSIVAMVVSGNEGAIFGGLMLIALVCVCVLAVYGVVGNE